MSRSRTVALYSVISLMGAAALVSGCGGSSTSTGTPPPTQPTVVTTATTLTVSPNPATAAGAITLTAQVSAASGTPTGTVTFLNGTASLGTANLTATGAATLSTTAPAAGTTSSLTAQYAGTTGFAASISSPVSLVVPPAGAPSAITAHASFSFAQKNQTIAGFGGAEAFYGNYLDSHPYQAEIDTALFDPNQGLGLNFLRLQNNYYQFNGSNAATFDTDNTKLISQAVTAHGGPVTVEMSSWTPPPSLKSNNSVNGCTGTTNGNCTSGIATLAQVNGAYNYAGFGQFWLDSLNAYAALGVKPDYISIQNEPDFAASYVGCRFNPTEAPLTVYGQTTQYASYGQAFAAVYNKINGGTLTSVPKMLGPETFSTGNVQSFLTEVPAADLSGIAHHLYNVSSGGNPNGTGGYTSGGNPDSGLAADQALAASYPTALKIETEYYQTPGFYNAIDIHNALAVAGDNAYFFWALAWPSTLANGVAVDQAGLVYIDSPYTPSAFKFPHGWTPNDSYYAMEHFSRFIKPGYIRYNATVDNTADERVSVYQSPDAATTVIVLLNVSTTVTDGIALDLSSLTYSNSTVYRSSFATAITDPKAERFAAVGSYNSSGINMPPQSAVTVVLTK